MRVDDPARSGTSELPDGRLLGWAEWGPRDGVPVLLVPGAATSRSLGADTGAVDALGVRLISVDRPGLGASSPAPDRTFASFADDIRRFADLRGLGRLPAVANSQGAPFALACAAVGAVGALAVVSGADEVAAPEFRALLPADLRGLVDAVAADRAAAAERLAGFGADAMWAMVTSGAPDADLAVYREPGFERAYRRALAEGFAQGPEGYARDTVLAMGRWPFDPARIAVPVDLWYGALDTAHSPDNGAALAGRIPGALRHVIPGAGGSLLWTHSEDILRTLLARAAG
ncbi:alpha/beta fold hydrolase [Murinocardiopsis flavida]|uniref:alpha/beta fold hydrolase n=1 Tax=Murinocardiopsis flavida TaxID=645275 RepID=UPI001FECFB46|nr:alpha/beta hydrolase [Murinocardiopsis flavida]